MAARAVKVAQPLSKKELDVVLAKEAAKGSLTNPDPPDNSGQVIEKGSPKGPKAFAPDPLIYQQIEQSSDYYPPALYAVLLSYYPNLQLQQDSLSTQFIPLTAVKDNRQKGSSKQFVIGIIPPSANVTGKLLDRSSSIASTIGVIPEYKGARLDDIAPPGEDVPQKGTKTNWGIKDPSVLGDGFWVDFVSMCLRLGIKPEELAAVIYTESGFNPGAEAASGPNSKAKGLIQNLECTLTGSPPIPPLMTKEQWEKYGDLPAEDQLYFIEKTLGGRIKGKDRVGIHIQIFGGYDSNPNGILYASLAYQDRYINAESLKIQDSDLSADEKLKAQQKLSKTFKNSVGQQQAYEYNKNLDRTGQGAIFRADFIGLDKGPPGNFLAAIEQAQGQANANILLSNPFLDAEGARKPWVDDGSPAAAEIRAQLNKIAKTGLNATELGERFQAAQRSAIVATQLGLEKMARTPPLRMLVNPKSFSVRGEKITSDGNWGRNGPIIEHWGDNQDKISGSGTVSGFYALAGAVPGSDSGSNGPGLTRTARNFSSSYQNFMSLYLLYRNNAGLYLPDDTQPDKRLNLSLVGSVYLYYDNIIYIGSFDTFNITEDDTKPFSLDYSFEFTVRAAFLLDRPNEPGFTYGAPAIQPQTGQKPPISVDEEVVAAPVDPEAPEPAARTKAEIDADRQRLDQKLKNGEISPTEHAVLISALNHEESPQTPGNEPGAVLAKIQRAEARARAWKKFYDNEISDAELQARLKSIGED